MRTLTSILVLVCLAGVLAIPAAFAFVVYTDHGRNNNHEAYGEENPSVIEDAAYHRNTRKTAAPAPPKEPRRALTPTPPQQNYREQSTPTRPTLKKVTSPFKLIPIPMFAPQKDHHGQIVGWTNRRNWPEDANADNDRWVLIGDIEAAKAKLGKMAAQKYGPVTLPVDSRITREIAKRGLSGMCVIVKPQPQKTGTIPSAGQQETPAKPGGAIRQIPPARGILVSEEYDQFRNSQLAAYGGDI